MKKIIGMTVATLALFALVGAMAFAKGKSHTITFNENTIVNGTVVKKGEYQAEFNEQTNELSILNGRHVVVTTKVKEKSLDMKASATTYEFRASDNGALLTKVTFGGDRYSLMIGDGQAAEGQ